MSKWNKILEAICTQHPYSPEDILLAYDVCGESYDRLLVALESSLSDNRDLIETAFMLRQPLDLASYSIDYECDHGCGAFGCCPGHIVEFSTQGASDILNITWRKGETGEYVTSFDANQTELLRKHFEKEMR